MSAFLILISWSPKQSANIHYNAIQDILQIPYIEILFINHPLFVNKENYLFYSRITDGQNCCNLQPQQTLSLKY